MLGPYRDEALAMVDIREITSMPGNQEHYAQLQRQLLYWLRRCDGLGIPAGEDRIRLRALQNHIATTVPQDRCPCKNGKILKTGDEHWGSCKDGARLREEETIRVREEEVRRQQAELEADIRRRHQAAAARINAARTLSQQLNDGWNWRVAGFVDTDVLRRKKWAIVKELAHRMFGEIKNQSRKFSSLKTIFYYF